MSQYERTERGLRSLATFAIPVRRVLLLGSVAGYVDAFGFIDLNGMYTAAMTGNTVQLGIALSRQHWPTFLLIAFTIASFFCGCLIASLIRRHLRRPPVELFIMAGLLATTEAVRWRLSHLATVELPLLTIAMAMQGETVSRFGGLSIQTIVVTNNVVKCADALVGYLGERISRLRHGSNAALRIDIDQVIAPGSAWLAYMAGAAGGSAAAMSLPAPLIIPIVLLMLTAADLLLWSDPVSN